MKSATLGLPIGFSTILTKHSNLDWVHACCMIDGYIFELGINPLVKDRIIIEIFEYSFKEKYDDFTWMYSDY